jgi:SAM-dependent methyltransferase
MAEPNKAWDYVQDWDVELMGPEVRDPEQLLRWSRAFAIAGGLPYIWRELARPISEIIYSLLEARKGDKILIIGEAVGPAGWADDLRAIVGETGRVDSVEIIKDGRRAVGGRLLGRNGMLGCWQWKYTEGIPDAEYDCVAALQSAQHCDDWRETGPELLRVMKPGRRIVFAEAVYGGPQFLARVNADVHIRQWFNKALETHMPVGRVSTYSGEQLKEMLGDLLDSPQCMEWHGIEMFWGRKRA